MKCRCRKVILIVTLSLAVVIGATSMFQVVRGLNGVENPVIPIPVTGTLTLGCKHEAGWTVTFEYDDFDMQGATAIGVTDNDGRFAMSTPSAHAPGVYPGPYRVGIVSPYEWAEGNVWWTDYESARYSGLTANVVRGSENDFKFDLVPLTVGATLVKRRSTVPRTVP